MRNKSSGFTLVELMISLVLGLIVIAAAVQLLISGQRSLLFQSAVADVQDNANIGINYIVADLHHANLNFPNRKMLNNKISGLVVKPKNYIEDPSKVMANAVYTEDSTGPSFVKKDGKKADSDVLVIQYRPVVAKGYDCEGNTLNSINDVIVQRYFLREDPNSPNGDLALACDAGKYANGTGTNITGLNGSGQIIMRRVDQFKILIGVLNGTSMAYLTPEQFAENTVGARAVSIQISALVRSVDNSGSNTQEKTDFKLLNESYSLERPKGMTGKFMRVPVEQTVVFRNALGDDS